MSRRDPQTTSKGCTVRHAVSAAADRGRIAPNGRPISRLAGIVADSDEGEDAAAEARVLSRQEEGALTGGGGERYEKKNHRWSLLMVLLSKI